MGDILSWLFDLATDPLGLPLEAWKEWIVLLVISELAYWIAFGLVGRLYSNNILEGRTQGSLAHWIIRGIVFVIMWAVTYAAIVVYRFVLANWIWIVSVIGVVGIVIAMFFVIRAKCKKKDKEMMTEG